MISRKSLISISPFLNIYSNDKYTNDKYTNKCLLISCKDIGKSIINTNDYLNLTITTTKPKRYDELIKDNIKTVLIPQMEINNDEIFREECNKNDIIIVCDTMSIFSIHTYYRTCERLYNALKNKQTKTQVILISNINYYGCYLNGEIINENSEIKPLINKNKNWKINNYNNALIIKNSEDKIKELSNINNYISYSIIRPGFIWNEEIKTNIIKYLNENNNLCSKIRNGYINLSYTDDIANFIKFLIKNKINGIYNIITHTYKNKDFLKNNNIKINWIDNELDSDYFYSLDINKDKPNSQRFNMKIDCNKIYSIGYRK